MTTTEPGFVPATRLISRDLGDEVVVVELDTDRAHCLHGPTAHVWRAVHDAITPFVPDDQEAVDAAATLADLGLVVRSSDAPDRRLLLRAGMAAGALAGIAGVETILLPSPAAAASGDFSYTHGPTPGWETVTIPAGVQAVIVSLRGGGGAGGFNSKGGPGGSGGTRTIQVTHAATSPWTLEVFVGAGGGSAPSANTSGLGGAGHVPGGAGGLTGGGGGGGSTAVRTGDGSTILAVAAGGGGGGEGNAQASGGKGGDAGSDGQAGTRSGTAPASTGGGAGTTTAGGAGGTGADSGATTDDGAPGTNSAGGQGGAAANGGGGGGGGVYGGGGGGAGVGSTGNDRSGGSGGGGGSGLAVGGDVGTLSEYNVSGGASGLANNGGLASAPGGAGQVSIINA